MTTIQCAGSYRGNTLQSLPRVSLYDHRLWVKNDVEPPLVIVTAPLESTDSRSRSEFTVQFVEPGGQTSNGSFATGYIDADGQSVIEATPPLVGVWDPSSEAMRFKNGTLWHPLFDGCAPGTCPICPVCPTTLPVPCPVCPVCPVCPTCPSCSGSKLAATILGMLLFLLVLGLVIGAILHKRKAATTGASTTATTTTTTAGGFVAPSPPTFPRTT